MILWWVFFAVFVVAMLVLDLGIINRKSHVIKIKEALLWTSFWVMLALINTFKGEVPPAKMKEGHLYAN
ncbi:MAG: hypothetical protein Q8O28_05010 [Smithellaceae bacterium]|nr:hypothetical protein [Smithellaceae bacterium]